MEQDFNIEHWQDKKCPPVNCREKTCECGLEKVFLSSALGDDSKDSPIAPKNGAYCNAIVVYEANSHVYIYSKEGVPTLVETDGDVEETIEQLEDQLAQEILDRQAADNTLQGEIDDLKNSPDVVDIVQDYAALQAYDTSKLGDNDIVRVLADETHDGDSTYYRWSTSTSSWTYIGGISIVASTIFYADRSEAGSTRHIYKDEGLTQPATAQDLIDADEVGQVVLRIDMSNPSITRYFDGHLQDISYMGNWATCNFKFLFNYTYYEYAAASASDSSYTFSTYDIQEKLTAGTNISISGSTISATDTTYSDFTGTDGNTGGTSGLVPAPATTDAGKFLKADGTWDTVGTIPTVVQTPGNSQTDVMSQNATTSMVFADPAARTQVRIGNTGTVGNNSMSIGHNADASSTFCLAVGVNARAQSSNSTAIGAGSSTGSNLNSVALGYKAATTRDGEVNVGVYNTNTGYNNTPYRVIGGAYDGQDAHDVATVGQLDGRVLQNAGAPTTSTVGTVGQLLEDTTNGKLYQCTAVDTTDPDNPSYTWDEVGAGGGGGIRTLTTADYNYPVDNPTYINLGLFDPGIYFVDDNAIIYNGRNANNQRSSHTFIVTGGDGNSNIRNIMVIYPASGASSNEYKISFYYTFTDNPQYWNSRGNVLSIDYIVDNLTTNNASRVLSAAQGKVLKDLIDGLVISGAGAPTTSTAGTVGQLYEDTTNGKLYQCTAVSGSTYTWTEVGAGGIPQYGDIINIGPSNTVDSGNNVGIVVGKNAQLQSSSDQSIRIGTNGLCWGPYSIAIGYNAQSAAGNYGSMNGSIAIGKNAVARSNAEIAIGAESGAPSATLLGVVSLGAYSKATRTGEVNIGSTNASYGFSSTNYRVIGGVHDGQELHDAATVAQGNTLATTAPDTSTVGVLGQLWTDTTNMHTYQCTAISGSTYTWTQRW